MRAIVIYHANCWDGFCAAWLFRRPFPNAEFVPAHHGTPPPDVAGKEVYIVDFSYKRDAMLSLCCTAAKVVVLDHHVTAQTDLAGLADDCRHRALCVPEVVFDMKKSGGRLAWEYLYGTACSPWLVDYTEDRDLWRHVLPNSGEVNAALRSYPLNFATWDDLDAGGLVGSSPPDRLVAEGAAILRAERQIIDSHVRNAREIEMAGHKVLAVNATTLFSEIADELAAGRPFGACYFDRGDGLRQWSLRSRDDGVDVSEIAKARGGGGHRSAAGFEEPLSAA